MTGSKTNKPLKKKFPLAIIVVLALGVPIALTSWLVFGNIFQLGTIFAISIAVIISSFFVGIYIGRNKRRVLWLTSVLVLLGATVGGLNYFGILGYVLSSVFAFFAFCIVVAGVS